MGPERRVRPVSACDQPSHAGARPGRPGGQGKRKEDLDRDLEPSRDLKACWGRPLTGSNLASSAALNCDRFKRSPRADTRHSGVSSRDLSCPQAGRSAWDAGQTGQEPPGDFQTPRIEGAEPVAAAPQTAVAGDLRGPLFATFDLWPDDETVRVVYPEQAVLPPSGPPGQGGRALRRHGQVARWRLIAWPGVRADAHRVDEPDAAQDGRSAPEQVTVRAYDLAGHLQAVPISTSGDKLRSARSPGIAPA